jgi:hypothetical protein
MRATPASPRVVAAAAGLLAALLLAVLAPVAGPAEVPAPMASTGDPPDRSGKIGRIVGTVRSAGVPVKGYRVSVRANLLRDGSSGRTVGRAVTDRRGRFDTAFSLPPAAPARPLLFLEARKERASLVTATRLRPGSTVVRVVVNERTTVAAGTAFAQFVGAHEVDGNATGMVNALAMSANLADPRTGSIGSTLATTPNGSETTTLATFNSLSNAVAACASTSKACVSLFDATTPPGGAPPENVLEAVANATRYPSYTRARGVPGDPLFRLARSNPVNRPALSRPPTSWLLFLKATGGRYSEQDAGNLMNGPGNFAIDRRGHVWVNDNAVPRPPGRFACAGERLLRFRPSGRPAKGTPFVGGGLSGAGYGITLDPSGRVWVSNFGFQDPPCALLPRAAQHDSVSLFGPGGQPLSPERGFTRGGISWPQGTASDARGTIWVGNCGNDSVTRIPGGDPRRAVNIALGPRPAPGRPQIKPFGVTTDARGFVWVAGNRSDTLSVLSPRGRLVATLPGTFEGRTVLSHPVGNATDTRGNVWVANSDWLDSPCPTRTSLGTAIDPSISLYSMIRREPHPRAPFTGGGLTLPWGIAVDGDDTVWVFNFGAAPVGTTTDVATGISRFCGLRSTACPGDARVGEPISPGTGYRSDALERITGGQIDPSGNVWMTNNWKIDADPFVNPFGNAIVVAIGAAAPLATPLIGPPVPADR